MTTKSLTYSLGNNLENHAVLSALCVHNPNPRSPAFALQKIYLLLRAADVIEHPRELGSGISKKIDEIIQDKVTWNDQYCHWQVGKGENITFEKIAQTAIRWYVHDWDFKRHIRDAEVEYPEDFETFLSESEFKHLAHSLLPAQDELTRRILKSPNNNNCFYYLDVVPLKDGQFSVQFGRFDKPKHHQTLGKSKDFWRLEVDTVLPQVQAGKVLSYTVHPISSKKGR